MGLRAVVVSFFGLMALAQAVAAEWSFETLDGSTQRLEDYRGKWVVVNYWATWCPPCLEEIPELVHFHDAHKENDALVIGVNMEDIDRESLVAFVDDNLISYPVVVGDAEAALGPIPGLPTTYLVDPDGRVVARQVGPVTADQISGYISQTGTR